MAALAMATAALCAVGMDAATAADQPILASISGTVTPNRDGTLTLTATGFSSQLGGAITYTGTARFTTTIPANSTPPASIAVADTLTETLASANGGDSVTVFCMQSAVRISPDISGSGLGLVYRGSDRWTVTKGTGQFKSAAGAGTGETYVDLANGTFFKVLSGTIDK